MSTRSVSYNSDPKTIDSEAIPVLQFQAFPFQ